MPSLIQEDIQKIVDSSIPERLMPEKRPPITDDHVAHILQLTQMGQTYLTEFPDHQENVRTMAEDPRFNLMEYQDSISQAFPSGTLERLNQMEDFQKAFEINSDLAEIFREVGISENLGLKGLNPSDWPAFGPVQKTLAEFKSAYDAFREEMVSHLQNLIRIKGEKEGRKRGGKKAK